MVRNIKLKLEYDGTDFHGFQIQPNVRTIQGTVEPLLAELFAEPIRLIAAGRTDEGVHARGQVVNLKTASKMRCETLRRALNAKLPSDVTVLEAAEVSLDFHARFSAISRKYEYVLSTVRRSIGRRYAWYIKHNLNFEALAETAGLFVGRHDFKSFCVAKSSVDDTECLVYSSNWRIGEDVLKFEIEADRFLHNMVRVIVGTMVLVGRGKETKGGVVSMLAAKDRRHAGPTAPPHGLFLTEVRYGKID
jgi:tRNA pseudouridine38-40 synthase